MEGVALVRMQDRMVVCFWLTWWHGMAWQRTSTEDGGWRMEDGGVCEDWRLESAVCRGDDIDREESVVDSRGAQGVSERQPVDRPDRRTRWIPQQI